MRRFRLPSRHNQSIDIPASFPGEALSLKSNEWLLLIALYGAFALIALLVFGTLSYRPF